MRQVPVPVHLALPRLAVRASARHHIIGSTTSSCLPADFLEDPSTAGPAESARDHADRP